MPVMLLGGGIMMWALQFSDSANTVAYGKAGSVAEESFTNIKTLAAFGGEQRSISKYDQLVTGAMKIAQKGGIITGLGLGFMIGTIYLSFSLGFWYGGKLVADDVDDTSVPVEERFSGGDALAVFLSVVFGSFSMGQAGSPISHFLRAGPAVCEMLDLVKKKSKIDLRDEGGLEVPMNEDIEFKNVHFVYPSRPEKPVFAGINFTIPKGKTCAFVGPSGSGKSTVAALLNRFYDPDEGALLVGGTDLKDISLRHARSKIGLVSQEPRLFATSIIENIRYGKLGSTDEECIEAAKRANAHEFIKDLTDGYNTYVGEGGGMLSGGQKQRVSIARCLLRDPEILILDEATSALDNESEKIVQTTINDLLKAKARTTILIAHRLTTIKDADKIVVLDNPDNAGAVVMEEGNHDSLFAMDGGLYHGLVLAQQHKSVDDMNENELKEMRSLRKSFDVAQRDRKVSELQKSASKVAVALNEKEKEKLLKSEEIKPPSWFRVAGLLKPDWYFVILQVIGAAVTGALWPMFAIVFAEFVDTYFLIYPDCPFPGKGGTDWIREQSNFWALIFIGFAAVGFVAQWLQITFSEWSGHRMVRELRVMSFTEIVHKEIGFFDNPLHTPGSLSAALSTDIPRIKGWVGDNLGLIIQAASSVIAGVAVSFSANVKLAAACLLVFSIMAPASALEMKAMQGNSKDLEEESGSSGAVVHEVITNIRTVNAFSLQDEFLVKYEHAINQTYLRGRKNAIIFGGFYGFSQFAQYGGQAFAYWYGARLLDNGEIDSLRDMFQAIFGLMMAAMGVGQAAVFMTDAHKAKTSAKLVYKIIDTPSKMDVRDMSGSTAPTEGNVLVDSIKFSYPTRPEKPIYNGLTLSAKKGQTVAFVGASGCGKSTVIQLLERFYDPNEGAIYVDGTKTTDFNLKHLRSQLGLVSQEPILFNGTIRENIKFGNPDATDEQVVKAAKGANAHKFITSFPDGYETEVGNFGGQLSGGQKQRVAIARAILRDPKILLLDEATSALDSESEKIVQQALDKLLESSSRTTFIIAHRLATIRGADKIVVFKNENNEGSIVQEAGTHDELMQIPGGIYKRFIILGDSAA
eukprot:GHVP01017563.1.p1 GENE.GHVP01017563.1~~GHVP01017563.1.p1  ORF type:complete len:1087 (+),score=218.99 GHVP01017563.1:278-3538(+)